MGFESASSVQNNPPKIVQGDSLSLVVNLKNKLDTLPMSLVNVTEITAKFRKIDFTAMSYTMTGNQIFIESQNAGVIKIVVPASDTPGFAVGATDVEIIVNQSGDISYHQYPGILNVVAPLF
jgi:hypothetical protein